MHLLHCTMKGNSSIIETIECMVRQERAYHPRGMDEDPISERLSLVSIESRGLMITFFYDLLGMIGSSRETAEVAVSYLDRFLATPGLGSHVLCNKKMFQLLSTTCLYTAVKIHEVEAMTPKLLADLSHGVFMPEEVVEMELILAQSLRWRLNPPTSLAFVRQYLELIPSRSMTREMKRTAYDLARYQTELALEDPRLFCEKKSLIAFMAVQNTLEQLQVPIDLSETIGMIVLGTEGTQQMTPYRYRTLQSILQLRLTSRLGTFLPELLSTPPLHVNLGKDASLLSTPTGIQYQKSPRSVISNYVTYL
jgi:Cyclin, N-terminal domain